jgi:hypothetical protein
VICCGNSSQAVCKDSNLMDNGMHSEDESFIEILLNC